MIIASSPSKYIQIQSTFEKRDDASKMATGLLDAKLAACCRVSEMQTHYDWKGKRESNQEFLLTATTKAKLFKKCEALIAQSHPYETPAIMAIGITHANKSYANWVKQNLARGARDGVC